MSNNPPAQPRPVDAEAPAAGPGWQPQIVAMVCRWCTYAGADLAGTSRLAYPAAVRLIRFPCTGRMDPLFILKAFEQGADGVLVSGCHPGDCHYVQGNLYARRRFTVFKELMDFIGFDPRRLHFSWVSASEGAKWVRVVNEVTAAVREAGPAKPRAASDARLPSAAPIDRAPPSPQEQEALAARLRRSRISHTATTTGTASATPSRNSILLRIDPARASRRKTNISVRFTVNAQET